MAARRQKYTGFSFINEISMREFHGHIPVPKWNVDINLLLVIHIRKVKVTKLSAIIYVKVDDVY